MEGKNGIKESCNNGKEESKNGKMGIMEYGLRKVAENSIDAAHSISRNIAEGYCRRSLKEYLNHLNFALGSCGEFQFPQNPFFQLPNIPIFQYSIIPEVLYL
jgi:hypothetical protein